MKQLTITQEYFLCAANNKGTFTMYNQKAIVCLVISGLLELQLEQCITMKNKEITVCNPLPAHMQYIKPLYDTINQGKPIKIRKVIDRYLMSLSDKKINELVQSVRGSLQQADLLEPVEIGLFRKKEYLVPKKQAITSVVEKLRAELLEDGELTEEAIAMAVLLQNSNCLKNYFSKFEQDTLKTKMKEIKSSEANKTAKEMVEYLEAYMISLFVVIT